MVATLLKYPRQRRLLSDVRPEDLVKWLNRVYWRGTHCLSLRRINQPELVRVLKETKNLLSKCKLFLWKVQLHFWKVFLKLQHGTNEAVQNSAIHNGKLNGCDVRSSSIEPSKITMLYDVEGRLKYYLQPPRKTLQKTS